MNKCKYIHKYLNSLTSVYNMQLYICCNGSLFFNTLHLFYRRMLFNCGYRIEMKVNAHLK